jgi:hypothetical protein
MTKRLVLNEEGGLTQSAGHYDYTSEDGNTSASDFLGRVDATEHGMVGRGGTRARQVGGELAGDLNLIATNIADQAQRLRTSEGHLINHDADAGDANMTAQSEAEALRTELNRPIEA